MRHASQPPPTHQPEPTNGERLRRIAEEFRAGYELLETIDHSITYFGSAQAAAGSATYDAARELARRFAADGFTTVTGGGPGIMEAANRGAVEAGGRSVGFNIMLETERRNQYVREGMAFHYLFVRKVMLTSASHAYVFFPGGFGTLDEFFEISTLIHIHRLHQDIPIVLVGAEYWQPLLGWMKTTVVDKYQGFDAFDLNMWMLVNTVEEAYQCLSGRACPVRLHAVYSGA
jgi:uncharacterized protein (TIGR00730 family)